MNKNFRTVVPYVAILAGVFVAYGAGRIVSVRPQAASASSRFPGGAEPMPSSHGADHTGMTPDCSVSLVTMFGDAAATGRSLASGVPVEIAKSEPLRGQARATGRVEADENSVHILRAGANGWVTSLGKNPVGTVVKKDEVLATFFSNDYLRPQQAYLFALANLEGMQTRVSGPREQVEQAQSAVHATEDALRLLGMSDPQLRELAVTHQTMEDIVLTAPVSGVVAARKLLREQNISSGDELYRIVDLERVWIFADLAPVQADRGEAGHGGSRSFSRWRRVIRCPCSFKRAILRFGFATVESAPRAQQSGHASAPQYVCGHRISGRVARAYFRPRSSHHGHRPEQDSLCSDRDRRLGAAARANGSFISRPD